MDEVSSLRALSLGLDLVHTFSEDASITYRPDAVWEAVDEEVPEPVVATLELLGWRSVPGGFEYSKRW